MRWGDPHVPTPPLTLAIRDYDFVTPLATGDVTTDGLHLTLRRSFDALQRVASDPAVHGGEASLSRYVQRFAAGDRSVVGLPLFVMREFRHRNFYVRRDSGLRTLAELAGRWVAVDGWPNSGNTWSRALMREEGVALDRVRWLVGRVHAHDTAPPSDALPPGVELSRRPLRDLLLDGELDVLIWAWTPEGFYEPGGPMSCSSGTSSTGIPRRCAWCTGLSRRRGRGPPRIAGSSTSRAPGSSTIWRLRPASWGPTSSRTDSARRTAA